MAFILKETRFSLLENPKDGYVFLGADLDNSKNIAVKRSNGSVELIEGGSKGGGSTGDSLVVGSLLAGQTYGAKYIAHGFDVYPEGDYVHVQGNKTKASANYSHAEGFNSVAAGLYSHAQGEWTKTSGQSSFTGGKGDASHLVEASGNAAFNFSTAQNRHSKNEANYSAILSGYDNVINNGGENNVIFGGNNNTISTNRSNNAIIASTNVTVDSNYSVVIGYNGTKTTSIGNTVYVPSLILSDTYHSPDTDGALKFNGSNFQGYKNGSWVNLDVDTTVSNYVTTDTSQTITGTKTFNNITVDGNLTFNSGALVSSGSINIYSDLADNTGNINIYTRDGSSSSGDILLQHDTVAPKNGVVLIKKGVAVGGYDLEVNGDSYGTDWVASSDIRFKENIHTIDNPIEKVMQLRGVYFNRKDNTSKEREMGLIAQEVEKILPEVVPKTDNEEQYKGIKYAKLTGILIEAVKEQQKEIKELKSQITQLKK